MDVDVQVIESKVIEIVSEQMGVDKVRNHSRNLVH